MTTERRHFLRHAVRAVAAGTAAIAFPYVDAQPVAPSEVRAALPNARLQGAGRMRFFGLNIYDARLWVNTGFQADAFTQHALALELGYLWNLSGTAIAERSLQEMQRGGTLAPEQAQRWLSAMQEAFPDVKAGDRITGMHDPQKGARFWFNGLARATIADVEFSRLFFGIWLAASTSEPGLRAQLLRGAST